MGTVNRTAVINADGVVENVIVTEDGVHYEQLPGYQYVDSDAAAIGDTYADSKFTPPPVVAHHED